MKRVSLSTHDHTNTPKILGVAVCVGLLSACQSLPSTPHLAKSTHLTQKAQNLGTPIANPYRHDNPALSGYYPIATGADAFAARSILSDMAQQTIDIQYYIWHNDDAGQLMIKDLWEAADRGVMVRILLDDFNGSPTLDKVLFEFAKHPNVAIRLANPMVYRKYRGVNFLTNAKRINRRMHNKSMTFDKQLSIIGGRNIGDEYLNNDKNNNFADLDVLLTGKVVADINQSFESYWTASSSYDIQTLVKHTAKEPSLLIRPNTKQEMAIAKRADQSQKARRTYREALKNSTLSDHLLTQSVPFRWSVVKFLADPTEKLVGKADLDTHLVALLQARLGRPKQQFSIISSYFVPTKEGVRTLSELAKSGVKVRILTNSFDATDVGAVHAGYGHWRGRLLASGVELYELKTIADGNDGDNKFWRNKHQTTTSLHAKAFAVDGHQVFIGSYNIDPRSANINTELGVLISDEQLASQLHQALQDEQILHQAYKVILTKQNTLQWHTIEQGKYTIYTQEPKMTLKDRSGVAILGVLPIDWLL